jgi:putative membrane protein
VANFSEIAIEKSMRLVARALAARRLRTFASGLEHIPVKGPAVIVARHYHHLYDGLALAAAVPRLFHIVVALDWVRNRPTSRLMHALTVMARWPVILRADAVAFTQERGLGLFSSRDVLTYGRRARRLAVDLLGDGRILVIFPEGYPNIDPHYTPKSKPDEWLPFKSGFVNIVAAAEKRSAKSIPIIPAGLRYTAGQPWRADLKFGEAVYRKSFNDAAELILHLEIRIRQFSSLAVNSVGSTR